MLRLPQIMTRLLLWVERRQTDILEQLPKADQVGQSSLVIERLARHRGVVDQLLAHQVAEMPVLQGSVRSAIVCFRAPNRGIRPSARAAT